MIIPPTVKHIDFYRAIQKSDSKVKIKSRYKYVSFYKSSAGYSGHHNLYWIGVKYIEGKRYAKCCEFSAKGEEEAHKFIEDIIERYGKKKNK